MDGIMIRMSLLVIAVATLSGCEETVATDDAAIVGDSGNCETTDCGRANDIGASDIGAKDIGVVDTRPGQTDAHEADMGVSDPAIVGDWIRCSTADCSVLDDNGHQATDHAEWIDLQAKGDNLEPGEPYCHERQEKWHWYHFNGTTLYLATKTATKPSQSPATIAGDRLTIIFPGFRPRTYKRIEPTRLTGPCD